MQSGTDAILDADFSIQYVRTGSKEIDKLVNVYNEMINRLRIEKTAMSEQSYFIQKLIEVSPLGMIIMDFDGQISNINPSAQKILSIPADSKGELLQAFDNPVVTEILKVKENSSKVISVSGIDKYKCQVNEVIHQGFKRKFILIDDLSRELLETEKEAYGKVIRMMAHEVNNSMGAINSILDTVVEFGLSREEDLELKESLLIARKRNEGLSSFMANYASILRLPTADLKKINLSLLLKKTGQLFVPKANENNIKITFDIPIHQTTVNGDEVLLEQAISNMIKNAIESIGENGEVKISCSENPLGFTISDNGAGIEDKHAQKLFTPFFSTKTTGQGVGLMLIRDILQSHKTEFTLSTDKESGWTNFQVLF